MRKNSIRPHTQTIALRHRIRLLPKAVSGVIDWSAELIASVGTCADSSKPQKAAPSEKTNVATPIPTGSVQAPPTTSNVTSPPGNALAAPAPLSLEPGSQTAKPIQNAGPENTSSTRTRVPQSSIPSVSQVKKVAPAPPAPTDKGAADPTAMSSIRDAASASPSKASNSHGEESAPALRAAPMSNGESHDTVSDTSSGQPSTPSASSSQKLAPTPYLQLSMPTGSSTESVQEQHTPSVSSSPGNALAAPVPMSSESGTQRARPIQNAEPDETLAIRRTPIPQSSISSIPRVRETTPVPALPTDNSGADPATTSSIRDAAPASLNKASNSHAAESVPMLNAPPVSSAASHDTISEFRPERQTLHWRAVRRSLHRRRTFPSNLVRQAATLPRQALVKSSRRR